MMDTVLNLGLNDETVLGLAKLTNDERFAYGRRNRRFIQMFSDVVLGIPKRRFEAILKDAREKAGVKNDKRTHPRAAQEPRHHLPRDRAEGDRQAVPHGRV